MVSKSCKRSFKMVNTKSFSGCAPCEPPKNNTTGFSKVKLKISLASSLLPSVNSFFIGFPTNMVLDKSKYSVFGKEIKIFLAHLDAAWFDMPGTESDSCINSGILKILAQKQTTKDPDPPLLKIKRGLINNIKKKLCKNPIGILNKMSVIFSKAKYLLILPETMLCVLMFSCASKSKESSSLGPI